MLKRLDMNARRLLIELILALALAVFAVFIGDAYGMNDGIAANATCSEGLPALARPGDLDDTLSEPAACADAAPLRLSTRLIDD